MKLKIYTLLILAGMAIVGCTSNTNEDGELDSNRVDTSGLSTTTDTNMGDTTSTTDSTAVDSTK